MGSEIMNAVTIYEINGMKYSGPRTINVTTRPRFLNFVRPRVDNQEYSIGADDLMRAVDRVSGQLSSARGRGVGGRCNEFNEEVCRRIGGRSATGTRGIAPR